MWGEWIGRGVALRRCFVVAQGALYPEEVRLPPALGAPRALATVVAVTLGWAGATGLVACNAFLGLEDPASRATPVPVVDSGPSDVAAPVLVCEDGLQVACGNECVDVTTSEAHCGGCEHSCAGQGCEGGRCRPVDLATDLYEPTSLRVEGGEVYWFEYDTEGTAFLGHARPGPTPCRGTACERQVPNIAQRKALAVIPGTVYLGLIAGGFLRFDRELATSQTVLADAQPSSAISDGAVLLWTDVAPPRVVRSYDGLRAEDVFTSTKAGGGSVATFALRQGQLYVNFIGSTAHPKGIYSVATNGFCFADDCIRFTMGPDVELGGLSASGTHLFGVDIVGNSDLLRFPLRNCNQGLACGTRVATMDRSEAPWPVVADDQHVYWGNPDAILRAPADGTPCPAEGCPSVLPKLAVVYDLAIDDRFLYAAVSYEPQQGSKRTARILRIPK